MSLTGSRSDPLAADPQSHRAVHQPRASIFAALRTKATVVGERRTMLDFCDPEIVEALQFHPARPGSDVPVRRGSDRRHVGAAALVSTLASGKQSRRGCCIVLGWSAGQTDQLDLGDTGFEADGR